MPGPLGKDFLKSNPIKCQFHNGEESVQGWVVRKIGSTKFRCQDEKGKTAICHLVPREVRQMSSLKKGEMVINVKLKDGTLVQVARLKKKTMKVVSSDPKYNGMYQDWSFDTNPGFAPPTPAQAVTPKKKDDSEKEASLITKIKEVATPKKKAKAEEPAKEEEAKKEAPKPNVSIDEEPF